MKLNSTVISAASQEKNDVYEYIVDPPLPFQPGDILGVLQPDNEESRLQVDYDTAVETPCTTPLDQGIIIAMSLILLVVIFRC